MRLTKRGVGGIVLALAGIASIVILNVGDREEGLNVRPASVNLKTPDFFDATRVMENAKTISASISPNVIASASIRNGSKPQISDTKWQHLNSRSDLDIFYQLAAESGDFRLKAAATLVIVSCAGMPQPGVSDADMLSLFEFYNGKLEGNKKLASMKSKALKDLAEVCKTGNTETDLKRNSNVSGSLDLQLLRTRNSRPYAVNSARQIAIQILSSPSEHPLAFDLWLTDELWREIGKQSGFNVPQKSFVEDELYGRFIGVQESDSFRTLVRCGTLAKCDPVSVLSDDQRKRALAFVEYIESAIRYQRWNQLF